MLSFDEIINALQDRNIQQVAKDSGINAAQLYMIRRGNRGIKYSVFEKLEKHLQGTISNGENI